MLLDLSTPAQRKAISLTPLIDVVFILLLFFMLSSSFSRWFAIDMSMPSDMKAKQSETHRVKLMNNQGQLSFHDKTLMLGDQRLTSLLKKQTNGVILVDAENNVRTQFIVNLIDQLKQQGFENVSLGNTFESKGIYK